MISVFRRPPNKGIFPETETGLEEKKAADEPRPEVVREETPKNWAAAPGRCKIVYNTNDYCDATNFLRRNILDGKIG